MFLIRKRHWFLHPRFSFFTMLLTNKVFFSVFCVLSMFLRFFFSFFFIISIIVFISTFSFSIRNRYTIRIYSRFRGFYNFFMFLLLFLRRSSIIINLL